MAIQACRAELGRVRWVEDADMCAKGVGAVVRYASARTLSRLFAVQISDLDRLDVLSSRITSLGHAVEDDKS